MICCNNPFQPFPENVIWLCDGQSIPDGWVETARFEFDCGSAVAIWPEGLPLPQYPSSMVTISVTGGVVSYFNKNGIDSTQIIWRNGGGFVVSDQITQCEWALIGGGGSGGNSTAGSTTPGGGGAAHPNIGAGIINSGAYEIIVGAGGAPVATMNNGTKGGDSVLRLGGVVLFTSEGGGYGGIAAGGDGGNGGGAGSNSPTVVNLGGSGFRRGGNSYPNGTNTLRRGGGGGGAGGDGQDGDSGIYGAGGPGITLTWMDVDTLVCEGGNNQVGIEKTTIGSGSMGQRLVSTGSIAGQDGAFILVFPTANATVI